MKALIIFAMLFSTDRAFAMNARSAADLAAASSDARSELKQLKKDFNISVHQRVASESQINRAANEPLDDGSMLLAAEIETLPGAEVTEPWILPAQTSGHVIDRESVGTFESAQLVPGDGASHTRVAFGTK